GVGDHVLVRDVVGGDRDGRAGGLIRTERDGGLLRGEGRAPGRRLSVPRGGRRLRGQRLSGPRTGRRLSGRRLSGLRDRRRLGGHRGGRLVGAVRGRPRRRLLVGLGRRGTGLTGRGL